MKELFQKEKINAVVHFAAFASVPDSVARPKRYYDNNVSKMLSLLDTIVESGIKYVVSLHQRLLLVNLNTFLLMRNILKSRLIHTEPLS